MNYQKMNFLNSNSSTQFLNPNFLHPLDLQVQAGLRGDFETGWKIAQELAQKTPNCNRAAFNRAWYEMMHGNLLEGLKLLDRGRWEKVFGDQPLPTDKPIYKNEDLNGKNLLLCGEGGLGDEIINVRFAKNFADRGAKVTVTCDPSLKSIFSRVPGVVSVVGHRAAPDVFHDYWVPGMSAARVLELEYSNLNGDPYLFVDPEKKKEWSKIFSQFPKQPKVGLRFYGNPEFEHEQHRKFPREPLVEALNGMSWFNLQKEENPLLKTWEDTLAAIDQLDLVITSCTSVAHASAALGKETWVLVPILPYYIWALPGETSPWYKTVKLYRQTQFGDWTQVFQKIKLDLEKRKF